MSLSKESQFKIISPIHEAIELSGDISYGESQRAWNLIRLKKEIINEFPQLKKRRESFGYNLILHRSYKELKKAINKMEEQGLPVPLMMFIGQKG